MRKSSTLQTFLLSCLLGTEPSHIVLLSPPYKNSQHTDLHHPFQAPSHCLEKSFSWNWFWNTKWETLNAWEPQMLHYTEHLGAVFRWVLGSTEGHAIISETPIQPSAGIHFFSTGWNKSILHFTWGYSKSLPLSYKKSPLTSVLRDGKQGKERQGALDPI